MPMQREIDHRREDLIAAALQAQQRLARALHTTSDAAWLQLDLTITQLKALFVLAEAALPVSRLATALGIGRPAATNLVERLVQLGLALRAEDPLDRRRTLVRLTATGDDLVSRLREGGQARMCAWLGQLDNDDLTALVRGLQALARVAPARCVVPGPELQGAMT